MNVLTVTICFFHFALCFSFSVSDNSQTVEDSEKTLTADVTDDSCVTEFTERGLLDYNTRECIDPVIEVKPEHLQDVKQETDDENNTEDVHYSVKEEPADDDKVDVLQCLLNVRF